MNIKSDPRPKAQVRTATLNTDGDRDERTTLADGRLELFYVDNPGSPAPTLVLTIEQSDPNDPTLPSPSDVELALDITPELLFNLRAMTALVDIILQGKDTDN